MVHHNRSSNYRERLLSDFKLDLRFIIATSFLVISLTSIPSIFGFLSTPTNKWFSGIIDNVHDSAQYMSWMREATNGIFTENKLTSEPSNAIFFNLHWWIPGKLAAAFNLTFPSVFQAYRIIASIFLIFSTYLCSVVFFDEMRKRRFSFLLALITSGLGWIWVAKKQITGTLDFPVDVHTTLGNPLYTMASSPHLTFSAALTLLVLVVSYIGFKLRDYRISFVAGSLALLLGAGHIYDLVTVWTVLGFFGVFVSLRDGWSRRTFWHLFLIVLLSAPMVVYWAWVASDANPQWKQALNQYDNLGVFTPPPPHLILLLGITFITAIFAYSGILPLKQQKDDTLFVKVWFVVTLLLVYLPIPFQIMLLTGYQIPLAVLATISVYDHMIPWIQEHMISRRKEFVPKIRSVSRLVPILFVLLIIPTNIYLLTWRMLVLNRNEYPFYLYKDELAGFQWLEEHSKPDEVVISSFVIGHYVPGLSGNKAFLANAVMTMDFYQKRSMVNDFYNTLMTDEKREQMLEEYGIDYIFYGPAERMIGEYDPGVSSLFEEVFSNNKVQIFAAHPIES